MQDEKDQDNLSDAQAEELDKQLEEQWFKMFNYMGSYVVQYSQDRIQSYKKINLFLLVLGLINIIFIGGMGLYAGVLFVWIFGFTMGAIMLVGRFIAARKLKELEIKTERLERELLAEGGLLAHIDDRIHNADFSDIKLT